MADPSGQSDGEKAISQLATMKEVLTSNGFSTVADLVTEYQKELAGRKTAEEARDKFNSNNDEAQLLIRTKGTETGILNDQITQLKKELEEMKADPTKVTPGAPAAVPPVVEETMDQVMSALTDEQKAHAVALLGKMTDDEAIEIENDPEVKLAFFKGLRADPSLKTLARPTSFFKTSTETVPAETEDAYAKLMKRLGGSIPGPSGASGSRTIQPAAGEKKQATWLKNSG
jgi:hypothetical protein